MKVKGKQRIDPVLRVHQVFVSERTDGLSVASSMSNCTVVAVESNAELAIIYCGPIDRAKRSIHC